MLSFLANLTVQTEHGHFRHAGSRSNVIHWQLLINWHSYSTMQPYKELKTSGNQSPLIGYSESADEINGTNVQRWAAAAAIVLLSAGKKKKRPRKSGLKTSFALSLCISFLIAKLKQQEIHCDPQPFTLHIHSPWHVNKHRHLHRCCSSRSSLCSSVLEGVGFKGRQIQHPLMSSCIGASRLECNNQLIGIKKKNKQTKASHFGDRNDAQRRQSDDTAPPTHVVFFCSLFMSRMCHPINVAPANLVFSFFRSEFTSKAGQWVTLIEIHWNFPQFDPQTPRVASIDIGPRIWCTLTGSSWDEWSMHWKLLRTFFLWWMCGARLLRHNNDMKSHFSCICNIHTSSVVHCISVSSSSSSSQIQIDTFRVSRNVDVGV